MPFDVIRHDITKMRVDAIVNTANPRPIVGGGTDAAIHKAAGPELLKARQAIGDIAVGTAAITPAFNLGAKYVIHTVGPVWNGGADGEAYLLRRCYESALELALSAGCRTVAFPLISTGAYGFPKDKALQIAVSVFSAFSMAEDIQIYLAVFDRESFKLSEKLFYNITCYIDENYVDACWDVDLSVEAPLPQTRRRRDRDLYTNKELRRTSGESYRRATLADALKKEDAGFTETLLRLIDRSGKKDSEIYKKANISKQHFSKIRNNPHYNPTKPTALALALALELNLEETRDLIGRAGYALTNSSKFDLIIRFFIEQGNYNIVEINIALFDFDQPLLGG